MILILTAVLVLLAEFYYAFWRDSVAASMSD
jgi:hypothetical protein